MSLPKIPKEAGIFEKFPGIFAGEGRVKGFEKLRDELLSNWEVMMNKGMNAYSVIKLVIETDRHAMFAEVQADKKAAQYSQKVWEEFQGYLQGGVGSDEQVAADTGLIGSHDQLADIAAEYDQELKEEGDDEDGEAQ